MKIRYTISTIAVLLFLVTLYSNLMAFMDGIVGFTKKNGESIGCVCHNLDPNAVSYTHLANAMRTFLSMFEFVSLCFIAGLVSEILFNMFYFTVIYLSLIHIFTI